MGRQLRRAGAPVTACTTLRRGWCCAIPTARCSQRRFRLNASITITADFPTIPGRESGDRRSQAPQIPADSRRTPANGTISSTIVDAKTRNVDQGLRERRADASVGKYVRIAARYQQDGTLGRRARLGEHGLQQRLG